MQKACEELNKYCTASITYTMKESVVVDKALISTWLTVDAASHEPQDWGNTYVEVDLTEQHMWYIVDGGVIFECDVVTGLPTPERETPSGVYDILEKIPGKTLVGATNPETGQPAYRTYVDYWMRVTYTGIGFHNADWKTVFGGELYNTEGSHGCINMSFNDAETFYGMIENSIPVVMHY